MSKSAQKYRSNTCAQEKNEECQGCKKLKDENIFLKSEV